MVQAQRFIETAEKARDLRTQLSDLPSEERSGVQFFEWSPGRVLCKIWNTETGEEVLLPRYQAEAAIYQPNSKGDGWLWTANPDLAPKPRVNSVKCFLHPESGEREVLDAIGVSTVCMSQHLSSNSSKWAHARNRHPSAFRAYQEENERRQREEDRAEQRKQTDAIMALAGSNKKTKAE